MICLFNFREKNVLAEVTCFQEKNRCPEIRLSIYRAAKWKHRARGWCTQCDLFSMGPALPDTQQSCHHHPVFTAQSPTISATCTSERNILYQNVEVVWHYIEHSYERGEVEYCTQKLVVTEYPPNLWFFKDEFEN